MVDPMNLSNASAEAARLANVRANATSASNGAETATAKPAPVTGGGAIESLARQIAGSTPPVDEQRIAEIKAAIIEGRYPIDPQRIAAAMINSDVPQAK
jgi:negative regulator of flagellin synthesis FlgM